MTRRREAPVLAHTIGEAALALRVSENMLRAWVRDGVVRTVRWHSLELVPVVELHRLIDDALRNGGTLPALAARSETQPCAGVSRCGQEASDHATDSGPVFGEVGGAATVGSSAQRRPTPPPTKRGAGVSAPTPTTTAG